MDLVMVAMGGLLCVAFAAFGVVAVVMVVVGRRGFQAFSAAVAQDPDWTVTGSHERVLGGAAVGRSSELEARSRKVPGLRVRPARVMSSGGGMPGARYGEWLGKAPPELPGAPLGEGFVIRGAGAAADRALGAERARALLGELPPGSAVRWGPDGLFVELPREGWWVDARSAAQLGAVADRVGALAEALRGTA